METLMSCRYNQCLVVITGICSATSLVCLCIGLATDNWLYAAERVIPEEALVGANATYRNTTTGLWRKCVDDPRKTPRRNCSYTADAFGRTDDDDLGPTDSILLSLRWVALFPLGSLLILLFADVIAIIGHWTATRVLNFLSGILSVIGGLVTLVGIIVYVSAVTGEAADNKPKPTAMDEPKFLYRYGPSFFVTVASFVGAEVTGVLAVHVYIHRYKQAYHKHRDIQQPTIIDGAMPRPISTTTLSTTPMSPRHHYTQSFSLRRSTSAAAAGTLPSASRWSNGHRAVGIQTLSSSAAALHGPSSTGGLLVTMSGCPTDDDCSDTYSPLSESCYTGPTQLGLDGGSSVVAASSASTVALQHHQSQSIPQQQLYQQQQQQLPNNELSDYNAFASPPPAYQTMNYNSQLPKPGCVIASGDSATWLSNAAVQVDGAFGMVPSGTSTGSLRPEQQSLLAESYRRTTPV